MHGRDGRTTSITQFHQSRQKPAERFAATRWRNQEGRLAIGGPRQIAGKLARIGRTLKIYVDPREVGRRLEIGEVVARLRGEEKFRSADELIKQMDKDKSEGIKILNNIN